MIISRTPFRISFFGGGTDFPEFYEKHSGAVLLTTINKSCYLSIHKLSPFFKYRYRASYSRTELVQHPSEFQHPLIRECLLHLKPQDGLEITHVSDLPGRTGLGTSSSFTVGLLHALHARAGERVTPEDLAREAIHIERECVGDPGGHQDQYAAAYGGFLRLDFSAGRQVAVKRLPLNAQRLAELERHVLLFYTGVEQSAETILHEQRQRVNQNVESLKRMLAMVNDAEQILCGSSSLIEFGRLLHESWQLKRSLASGITNSAVDLAYEAARQAGAIGGKLLGAGGRGFLLVFAPPERHAAITQHLSGLQHVPFAFSLEGSRIIFQEPE
jgi:D-glycero-alpha-D-manno-heptose-7-phosphate kinase